MTQLIDLASILRSKNAGPLTLTIDVLFDDKQTFTRVVQSGAINAHSISALYGIDERDVLIVEYAIVNAIKVSFPRLKVSGDIADDDVYGCQQHRRIAEIDIE